MQVLNQRSCCLQSNGSRTQMQTPHSLAQSAASSNWPPSTQKLRISRAKNDIRFVCLLAMLACQIQNTSCRSNQGLALLAQFAHFTRFILSHVCYGCLGPKQKQEGSDQKDCTCCPCWYEILGRWQHHRVLDKSAQQEEARALSAHHRHNQESRPLYLSKTC